MMILIYILAAGAMAAVVAQSIVEDKEHAIDYVLMGLSAAILLLFVILLLRAGYQ